MCVTFQITQILETSTHLTGGISLPKVFPILQNRGHCPTKAQESYVATKNSRELSLVFFINLSIIKHFIHTLRVSFDSC